LVGTIDNGISAVAWSPDDEMITLVSCRYEVTLLTRSFDLVAETSMSSEDLSLSRGVSVGWGKRETQFEGKGVKGMRDPTMPEYVDTGVTSVQESYATTVSWRGDSQYFAVSTHRQKDNRRAIRVYSRELSLDSISEATDGLEAPLAWRPSGNVICSIKRSNSELIVAFFERNGLRHGEFDLLLDPSCPIQSLAWNFSSTILAVHLERSVQLWTVSNYKWQLKMEVSLLSGDRIRSVSWDNSDDRLILAGTSSIEVHEFAFTITSGPLSMPHDIGLVAVLNGRKIALTPLKIANVPPPMCFRHIDVSETPKSVGISNDNKRICVLAGSSLFLYNWTPDTAKSAAPVLAASSELKLEGRLVTACFLENSIAVLSENVTGSTVSFYSAELLFTHSIEPPARLSQLYSSNTALVAIDVNNAVYLLHAEATVFPPPRTVLPSVPIWVGEHAGQVFALTKSGRLYADETQIGKQVTSACVSYPYIVVTNMRNMLKFAPLSDPQSLPADDSSDERCRAVETGAKLVTIIPSKTAVVLQMPRGNLETIFPRLLVIAEIRRCIDAKNYSQAWRLSLVNRVDLNFLYDYNPALFLENVDAVIAAVGSGENIDILMASLNDENTAATKFRDTITTSNQELPLIHENKQNIVCEAILKSLTTTYASDPNYSLSVLTAYLSMKPPKVETALALVSKKFGDQLDEAVQHLCFLQDVNVLYDFALGLYDLPLTLLIAQKSTKDPKEYVPFLQGLEQMSELRRKYQIDDFLKRYSKALASLVKIDSAFNEVCDYIVLHELYQDGLKLLGADKDKVRRVQHLYADFLYAKKDFALAGITYEMLHEYNSAVQSYKSKGLWREALAVASKASYSADELRVLAADLASLLTESHQYSDSATVYKDYLNDYENSILMFCKAYQFSDALRVAAAYDKESIARDGIADGYRHIAEFISECKAQYESQTRRLEELRKKKEQDPLAFYEGDEADGPDNVSVASESTRSIYTRYTGLTSQTAGTDATRRTSKNRRREERKRARGKKGSVYEEEYLINSLGRLFARVEDTRKDVDSLIEALVRVAEVDKAQKIQKLMVELVSVLNTRTSDL
ncbi:hypothetical protein CANCADRAFT_17514, partial [Tortispora caseinolytica NRRL Y-17796]